jgi:hypothetical protein
MKHPRLTLVMKNLFDCGLTTLKSYYSYKDGSIMVQATLSIERKNNLELQRLLTMPEFYSIEDKYIYFLVDEFKEQL